MAIDVSVTDANKEGSAKPNKPRHLMLLPDEIRPHAEALGGLVIAWGTLELQLSILFAVMLDLEFTSKGNVLMGHIEMKLRLKILNTLGPIVGRGLPNKWLSRLRDLLRHIENDLCPERNRMIHDIWGKGTTDENEVMTRIELKPKILKQTLALKFNRIQVSVPDIQSFTHDVLEATRQTGKLTLELKPSLRDKSL